MLRVGGLVDVVVEQELKRGLELIDHEPGALAEIGHGRIDDEEQPRLRFLHGVHDGEQLVAARGGQAVLDPLEARAIAAGLPVLLHERRGDGRLAHGDVVRDVQRVVGPLRLGGDLDPAIEASPSSRGIERRCPSWRSRAELDGTTASAAQRERGRVQGRRGDSGGAGAPAAAWARRGVPEGSAGHQRARAARAPRPGQRPCARTPTRATSSR
ncbi:hypothetical protein [Sorangium cellulosum]|uniref:hypothetical protein n=1 Tax=Sorangium cellulosum TaxID=56 RepID=UPI001F223926|nr:hypothetical protein [Sorangium cellulosum]